MTTSASSGHRASRSIPFTPGRGVKSRGTSAKEYDRNSTRKVMQVNDELDTPVADRTRTDVAQSVPTTSRMVERSPTRDTRPGNSQKASPEWYLSESSFISNPLGGRVPSTTPRKVVQMHSRDHQTSNELAAIKENAVRAEQRVIPLNSVDTQLQDGLLVEDLLYALVGIEGNYIHFESSYKPNDLGNRLNGVLFTTDPDLDPSLRQLVERILPLASYYSSITTFVEQESGLEYGTVMHALCAAIRTQLDEYEDRVSEMESRMTKSPDFTLQHVWLELHPMLQKFSLIHSVTSEIASITHADVLPQADDDDDDDDDDQTSDTSSASYDSNASQLERDRRALLGLDDVVDGAIEGGIVKGGEVLSMLWDRLTRLGGDPDAHVLYLDLFRKASQPYARILLRWITSGQLIDPYEEFFIVEDTRVTQASLESDPTDEYWERRYQLRDVRIIQQKEQDQQEHPPNDHEANQDGRGEFTGGASIPAFLEAWKHKVLSTGKYLNAIRECGIDVSDAQSSRVRTLFGDQDALVARYLSMENDNASILLDDTSFITCLENAYQRANAALLRLLVQDKGIKQRLSSMKHFFFFSQTDFLQDFLDQSEHELRKSVDPQRIRETTLLRLQTHLDMVLNSSDCVGFHDGFKEDLRVNLAKERVYDQLQRIADTKGVIELAKLRERQQAERQHAGARELATYLVQFDVHVQFPVSLVISKKNVLRWQFIHRCLLLLKVVERALSEVWEDQSYGIWRHRDKRPYAGQIGQWQKRIHALRQRMLLLVQQLLAFYTSEILEPNWHDLEKKLRDARSVDQFMKDHFDFLNVCRKQCMLTDYRYLESRVRIQEQCEALQRELDEWILSKDQADAPSAPALSTHSDLITKIEASWTKQSRTFRDVVNLLSTTDNPAALPLAYRLQTLL
ncbi:gamma tubulin complex Spc97/GCP2 subunit Alp4 [Malassezia psittaci]|uniref:Spindle pole body component n=1 Tax=Malassezia psittaci TaxID=1821823 RepID=A0AAF0F8M8_9BASI|nr:gamma tubulin complex Spc97/GCP2 subunit Alp4 [Malassezia psittaci]